mmetsp:Transcript_138094/g.327189  ORF Transcript_138094/g.327189 Transcript_138094/m.327189 type:complete len:207 (+) Transcript_138094:703-1323(+)
MLLRSLAPSEVSRLSVTLRIRRASSHNSKAFLGFFSSKHTTPRVLSRFAPSGVCKVPCSSRMVLASSKYSRLSLYLHTWRKRSPTPSPSCATSMVRPSLLSLRRCFRYPSLACTIQPCRRSATAQFRWWKPGPSSMSFRMRSLSSGTDASACSTLTAPRAAHTSPTPPVSSELRKSSASLGGMAMITSCFKDVAVYISKSHQTRLM